MQQIANDGDMDDKLSEKELYKKIVNIEKQLKEISKAIQKEK